MGVPRLRSVAFALALGTVSCSVLIDLSALGPGNDAGADAADATSEPPIVSYQPQRGIYQYRRNESVDLDGAVPTGGERYTLKVNSTLVPVVTPYLSITQAIVTSAGPCWRLLMAFVPVDAKKGHVESMIFCPSGGRLLVSGDWNTQSATIDFNFAVQTVTTTVSCAVNDAVLPAALNPGSTSTHSCTGRTDIGLLFDNPAEVTFVGAESVTLGTGPVAGYHVHVARKPSGSGLDTLGRKNDLKGTDETDFWFDPIGGMVLRLKRRIDTTTLIVVPVVGDVETRYEEASDWVLDSLTPLPLPDAGSDAAADAPKDAPVDAPKDAPADAPTDAPVDAPKDG